MKIGCLSCCQSSEVDEPEERDGFFVCPRCNESAACEVIEITEVI